MHSLYYFSKISKKYVLAYTVTLGITGAYLLSSSKIVANSANPTIVSSDQEDMQELFKSIEENRSHPSKATQFEQDTAHKKRKAEQQTPQQSKSSAIRRIIHHYDGHVVRTVKTSNTKKIRRPH